MTSTPNSTEAPTPTTEAATAAQPAAPTLIHRPKSILDRLRPEELFEAAQPLEVELGSGDGSFMANYARANPGRNFIGVERLLGRLRKLDRKGLRLGLKNLRLVRLEALYVMEFMIVPGSLRALHIYFPDPWPKRRHHKNRLINEHFARVTRRAMAPEGVVYLRTDNVEYFTQMREVFDGNTDFKLVETPVELSAIVTDFERNFNARGIPTLRAAYQAKA